MVIAGSLSSFVRGVFASVVCPEDEASGVPAGEEMSELESSSLQVYLHGRLGPGTWPSQVALKLTKPSKKFKRIILVKC